MPNEAQSEVMSQVKGSSTTASRIERILISFSEQRYQEYSRYRFAEEREWYEAALFYQRRQWLSWNDQQRRWQVLKQNPAKPKPMPVTNYFAKAINDNANQLQKVQIVATPSDDNAANRRGAQYAEKSIDSVDEESGFDVLRPLVAKHMTLWGMGITKDIFDASASAGETILPQATIKETWMLSCADCGQTSELPEGQNPSTGMPQGTQKCPKCGSSTTVPYPKKELVPAGSKVYTKGKILTEVPTVFEVLLPRTCRNPNLAKCIIQRYRKGAGELRRQHPDTAKDLKAENSQDTHEIYMEALRSLVNYNQMHDQTIETTTVTECWAQWDEVPQRVQKELTAYWKDDPQSLDTARNCGLFVKHAGGTMLAWGPNPIWGESPYTFFLWELDPASTYPKGASVDAVPIQKRLNRLDSLIELAIMSNAAGKWLWPKSQGGEKPTGSPTDVVAYDPMGSDKIKPEFVTPTAIDRSAYMLRAAIVQDMQAIANTLGIQQGQQPEGVKSFRGIAYLGAKAEESQGTQRMLWELGNQIRYRKVVRMAAEYWNDERKARVAGFNGKYGMLALTGELLKGEYQISFVPDSSRPRLLSEKQQAIAGGLQSGLIDPADPANREFIANTLRLDGLNLVGHLQYLKAERDLERLKQGQLPLESPFQDWQIFLRTFANFTLTEEFAELPGHVQQLIIVYTESISDKLAAATPAPVPPGAGMGQGLSKVLAKKPGQGNNPLSGIPGKEVGAGDVQKAAASEGADIAAQVH